MKTPSQMLNWYICRPPKILKFAKWSKVEQIIAIVTTRSVSCFTLYSRKSRDYLPLKKQKQLGFGKYTKHANLIVSNYFEEKWFPEWPCRFHIIEYVCPMWVPLKWFGINSLFLIVQYLPTRIFKEIILQHSLDRFWVVVPGKFCIVSWLDSIIEKIQSSGMVKRKFIRFIIPSQITFFEAAKLTF